MTIVHLMMADAHINVHLWRRLDDVHCCMELKGAHAQWLQLDYIHLSSTQHS